MNQPSTENAAATPSRNFAIDALRGAVMILMALDHAREFFSNSFANNPENLSTTTPILFFTRWITHFCAPTFLFLAGTAAFFNGQKRGAAELSRFLWSRGAWMVFLELTVMRAGWSPDPFYRYSMLQIIWAIGWSMIALGFLCRLPRWAVGSIALMMIVGHNALDSIHSPAFGSLSWLWKILHEQGPLEPIAHRRFDVAYPLIPWIGVMAMGFVFGPVMQKPMAVRKAFNLKIGITLTAVFILLRLSNLYGDPIPWSTQSTSIMTALSFLKCNKYPPSLCFLLMTLGPAFCLLSFLDTSREYASLRVLSVFGGTPLFYYVMHLIILRWTSFPIAYYLEGNRLFLPPPEGSMGVAPLPLWGAYLAWIAVVIVLYPLCKKFLALKRRHREWYWSYL